METRTREEIAEQAPSFEELIEKLRVENMATIEQYKYTVNLLKVGNNKYFDLVLNKLFSIETTHKSIDEFKEFLISTIDANLILYQNSLDGKGPKKKDNKYYDELDERIDFGRKYKELLEFKNVSVETDKEVEGVKGLVDGIL